MKYYINPKTGGLQKSNELRAEVAKKAGLSELTESEFDRAMAELEKTRESEFKKYAKTLEKTKKKA